MSLIKFNDRFPWNNSVFTNFLSADDLFNNDFFAKDNLLPAMNVKENDNDFEIELAVPGFSKDDFNVVIDNNGLHISAENSKEEEEKEDGYLHKEFSYNSFKRSIRLPESINLKKDVKAHYKHGILKLNLLKKEEATVLPKKVIEVS
ncbi:MAG TPA: Hsp20/alpha crystallin family protein [Flavobacteriia bacterium]|jgi:HSP20 family protein|nr:Hsp20/alpha crystallin family protein [Flavobacteriia bacterium]